MAATYEINGKPYVVVERFGWQHSVGMFAMRVLGLDGVERTAVSRTKNGPWRIWDAGDRCPSGT